VAVLEAFVFTIQDKFHQFVYNVEKTTPSAPWDVTTIQVSTPYNNPTLSLEPTSATPISAAQNSTSPTDAGTPINASVPSATGTPGAVFANLPKPELPSPTQAPWVTSPLAPLGDIPDEGLWAPYIMNTTDNIVAYRTFLQPDTERPYVTVGIVAFDLTRTLLHYELGSL
jgi:hypothetical protein